MNKKEQEVLASMTSIKEKYFSDLPGILFEIVFDISIDGIMGRAISGEPLKIVLHYSDNRVLEPKYRMGLVPLIAHELAHFINPVDPEWVMRERLPVAVMELWDNLLKEGYAKCSFGVDI